MIDGLSGANPPDDGSAVEDPHEAADGSVPPSDSAAPPNVGADVRSGGDDVEHLSDAQADSTSSNVNDAASPPIVDAATSGCPAGCPGNGYCAASECVYPSCIARLLSIPTSASGVYALDPDGFGGAPPFRAYCEMILDGGGWTLLLKVDGTRTTFVHDSPLWENDATFQPDSAKLDLTEAKLAGFATMPFEYVRVGMAQSGSERWLILPVGGLSLMSLMSSGNHPTMVGRNAWKRLLSTGSLQLNCNREGLNVVTTSAIARIGIVSNNQNDCGSCQSWIGFGAKGTATGERACGNFAPSSGDDGSRNDGAFGYVMVR